MIVLLFSARELYTVTDDAGTRIAAARIVLYLIAAAVCILVPFFVRWQWPARVKPWMQTCIYIVLIPVVIFITLYFGEYIHGFALLEIRKRFILFNAILAFAFFLLFHIITNRIKWAMMLTYVLIIFASALNYYIDVFRGEAASAADIFCIGAAANVAGNYKVVCTPEILKCVLVGLLILTLLTWLPKETPVFRRKMRLLYDVIAAFAFVFIIWLFAVSDWPNTQGVKVKLYRPVKSYRTHGELLNFTRSFYYMIVDTPEDYSSEACYELMDELGYESDPADYDDGQDNPNVIFILNESLSDFSGYEELGLTEDPLPYIHSLKGKDNAIVGNLHVDVFGGRTANTEYEIQTGNALYYMPENAVPFAMYVREPQPAMSWNLQDMGYSGIEAFHPYHASGYSRPRAYPFLGFERFVTLEDIESQLQPADRIRSWVSDSADFRYITKLYEEAREESEAPFYLYNVSMQNHGPYDKQFDNWEQDIEITGAPFKNLEAIADTKQFINLTQYSDEAFQELTAYFEKVDEPTVIVMYGDHLPNFINDFYDTLWGKRTGIEKFKKYTTPVVVWANYDINKGGQYDALFEDISVNYVTAEVMHVAGLPMTAYQKYLVDLKKELPVISTVGLLDADGNYYDGKDDVGPYAEKLKEYQYLVYNYQFDKENRNDAFYTLKSDVPALEVFEEAGTASEAGQ
ncbi:MAG: sulfatase-like hydrolase/transferase [Eubacterium sp.]|nr:sulfatase-like hydrolase/transferase [Eubacterium sp.]